MEGGKETDICQAQMLCQKDYNSVFNRSKNIYLFICQKNKQIH